MHSTLFAAFLAEAVVTDAPFMASAIAATARLVPETILYFMLICPWEWLENRATRGPQACPQPLLRCRFMNVTLITRLLPWRPPQEDKSGGAKPSLAARNKAPRAQAQIVRDGSGRRSLARANTL
jgi:hypothetical protein